MLIIGVNCSVENCWGTMNDARRELDSQDLKPGKICILLTKEEQGPGENAAVPCWWDIPPHCPHKSLFSLYAIKRRSHPYRCRSLNHQCIIKHTPSSRNNQRNRLRSQMAFASQSPITAISLLAFLLETTDKKWTCVLNFSFCLEFSNGVNGA